MIFVILIWILSLIAEFNSQTIQCPPQWLSTSQRCYNLFDNPVNITQAQRTCSSFGGRLMNIRNSTEYSLIKSLPYINPGLAWVIF